MAIDLTDYRATVQEQARIASLFSLIPASGKRALDIGARDGYLSVRLAERFESVIALDLERPVISHPRVTSIAGNVSRLDFQDRHFDVVLCAEVLEHLPAKLLVLACAEIARVARLAVIGVPFKEDPRCGRTTCQHCGSPNPPWGHVNNFDERTLRNLFPSLQWTTASYVGQMCARTNPLSTALLDYAGNPFGTYHQDEACVHCGERLGRPRPRTPMQRAATRVASVLNRGQAMFSRPRANWIHVLFTAPATPAS
ncbi:MAG: class I SAM-dependent methyltransferase [Bryobacteraceae bacterium]